MRFLEAVLLVGMIPVILIAALWLLLTWEVKP